MSFIAFIVSESSIQTSVRLVFRCSLTDIPDKKNINDCLFIWKLNLSRISFKPTGSFNEIGGCRSDVSFRGEIHEMSSRSDDL